MATLIELEVPAEQFAGAVAFRRVPTLRLEFVGVVGTGAPLVVASGPDYRAARDALEADPSLSVVASLTETGEAWLFRLEPATEISRFEALVSENQGAVLELVGHDGTWSVELLFHDRYSVSKAHDEFVTAGFSVTVTRMTSLDGAVHEGTNLTRTQYETIVAAHERGYFDVPRQITLKELAAELDISHQALSERLRRSHATLVSETLAGRGQAAVPDR